MHLRDVHRAASVINHPAWKASDCKLSGVNISPLLPNRLANQNSRFALNFGSSRSQPYVTGWENLALFFPSQTMEDNKARRIWRTQKTRQTSCVLLPLSHFSYNCIFSAGEEEGGGGGSGGPIFYSLHQLVAHILKAEVTVDLQIIS